MNINVSARDFKLTRAIDEQARKRLSRSLRYFGDSVISADVFLKDLNGPRGGIDKHVLVCVRLSSGHVVAVETTRANLYDAIRGAVRRTKRAVKRTITRQNRLAKRALIRRGYLHSTGGAEPA